MQLDAVPTGDPRIDQTRGQQQAPHHTERERQVGADARRTAEVPEPVGIGTLELNCDDPQASSNGREEQGTNQPAGDAGKNPSTQPRLPPVGPRDALRR